MQKRLEAKYRSFQSGYQIVPRKYPLRVKYIIQLWHIDNTCYCNVTILPYIVFMLGYRVK